MSNNQGKAVIAFTVTAMLSACSTTPSRGSPEYVEQQVYQCRKLCANSEVNIAQIEGLDCVCSKPQAPTIIYNPMMGSGPSSSRDDRSPASSQAPVIIKEIK